MSAKVLVCLTINLIRAEPTGRNFTVGQLVGSYLILNVVKLVKRFYPRFHSKLFAKPFAHYLGFEMFLKELLLR